MDWLSLLFELLITLSGLLIFETAASYNYVTPDKAIKCSDDQSTCLTLQEYASQPDVYFTNDTIFYFEPGNHTLNSRLFFTNLHNFTFQGLSKFNCNALLDPSVNVTWKNCSNIKVSSILFSLFENFTISIIFEHSFFVQLFNVTVFGNGHFGCSSVLSRHSTLGI